MQSSAQAFSEDRESAICKAPKSEWLTTKVLCKQMLNLLKSPELQSTSKTWINVPFNEGRRREINQSREKLISLVSSLFSHLHFSTGWMVASSQISSLEQQKKHHQVDARVARGGKWSPPPLNLLLLVSSFGMSLNPLVLMHVIWKQKLFDSTSWESISLINFVLFKSYEGRGWHVGMWQNIRFSSDLSISCNRGRRKTITEFYEENPYFPIFLAILHYARTALVRNFSDILVHFSSVLQNWSYFQNFSDRKWMQFFTRTKIVKYSVSDFSLNKGKDKWAIKTSSAIKGDIVKAYNDDGLTRLPMDILDAVMPK